MQQQQMDGNIQPAFQLDYFDPIALFTQQDSADHDFDKILGDLDLDLARGPLVQNTMPVGMSGLSPAPSDVLGLRELFGVSNMMPPQQQQQEQQEQDQKPVPAVNMYELLQQQQQQQLLQQQQQQQQEQAYQQQLQQQQQQQQQGLGVVYQLPSPFMQPMTALTTPGGLQLQGMSMYNDGSSQPAYLQQQQQQLQQLMAIGFQPGQGGAAAAPVFTFNSLPVASHLQQQQQQQSDMSMSMGPSDSSAGGGLYAMPGGGGWPYAQSALQGLSASPSGSGGTAAQTVLASNATTNGLTTATAGAAGAGAGTAAAAPAPQRRGRGKNNAQVPPGGEKPKGPSQRFRERQKATISTLEQEVTQKLAELQALSEENEMLKLRSAVLEAVTSGREYHMKIIKEHGPPTFDLGENSPHNSGPLSAWGSGKVNPAGSDCNSEPAATAGSGGANDSPRSASISSCNTGNIIAASVDSPAGAEAPAGAAAAADACPADPLKCAGETACTADMQKRSIRCIRQMTADDIIMHWRQFLHDVSEELLTADAQEEQQRLDAGQLGLSTMCQSYENQRRMMQEQQQQADEDSNDSAAFALSKVCRWCGCTNTEGLHMEGGCQPEHHQQQQNDAAAAAAPPAPAPATSGAGGGGGVSATDERLMELVNKYSYMTKFVALLNPGVLYSLFGRNLDTGEAAAYTDEHWRQVVTRLHLTKQQVTYVVACAELYFSSLTGIMHERQALHEALCRADGELSECQRRLLGVDGTLNQLQLLDRLTSNLKREHVLRIMLNCFVWGRILTAVQFAKTAVYSHPFFPDVHAMVCVLYEDQWHSSPEAKEGKVFPHRIAAAKAALARPPMVNGFTA